MGPLKTERFRRAKTGKPGDDGGGIDPKAPFASGPSVGRDPMSEGGGRRWNLMPDGNVVLVGVEGRTLTELCGDLPSRDPDVDDMPEGEAIEALDVLEAFDCVRWWPP